MAEYTGDKSLDPTPHRRQQARSEGHVAKSQDLGSAVLLLAGLATLLLLSGNLVGFLMQYCREQLGGEAWLVLDSQTLVAHWNTTLWTLARYVLPIFGVLFLIGVAINMLQTGFLFLPQRLAFDFGRLNPLQGLQRILSGASMIHLGLGAMKLAVAATVAVIVVFNQRDAILGMTDLAPNVIGTQMTEIVFWTAMKVGLALLILAVLDYGYQRWRHEQDLKMTPQELREELKNLEGNPQVVSRRKQVQRDLVLQRLAASVPQADILLTDADQLVVAIRYDAETMSVPVVVAKGSGASAEHMRRVANRYGVPMRDEKRIARDLYRRVDPNRPIPADRYAAVAELLAELSAGQQ